MEVAAVLVVESMAQVMEEVTKEVTMVVRTAVETEGDLAVEESLAAKVETAVEAVEFCSVRFLQCSHPPKRNDRVLQCPAKVLGPSRTQNHPAGRNMRRHDPAYTWQEMLS